MPQTLDTEFLRALNLSADKLSSVFNEIKSLAGKSQLSADAQAIILALEKSLSAKLLHTPDSASNPPVIARAASAFIAADSSLDNLYFAQKIIELIPLPIYLKDQVGRILLVNKACEDFFGWSREKVLDKDLSSSDYPHYESSPIHIEYDRLCQNTGEVQRYEAPIKDALGRARYGFFHKALLKGEHERAIGVLGAFIDITDYRLQQSKVESVESRLQRITNTVPVVVFQCEVCEQNLRFTFMSERVRSMRGLDPAALIRSPEAAMLQVLEEDRPRVVEGMLNKISIGIPWQVEYRIRLANGDIRWMYSEYVPEPEKTPEGNYLVTGIWQDITPIRQMQERLHDVTENIPVAVCQYRRTSTPPFLEFTFISHVIEKLIGIPAADMIDNAGALFNIIHEEDQPIVARVLAEASKIKHFEYRITHKKTGKTIWIRGESQAQDWNAPNTLWSGYFSDFTDEKKISDELIRAKSEAEAANRSKSEFLANMSHEIRTPMNGVIGMTDLVLDTELSEEQREFLLIAKSSSESLLTVINDILDFSKIEAGKLLIESISFNLLRMIDDTLKSLALRAHDKGLELVSDIAPDVPMFLIGDPGRLRQIIVNLISNALKFTEKGEVVLRAIIEKIENNQATLHFSVTDSGIGISPEKLRTIFDAFTQEDSSVTRKYGGTGLGLTISTRLVEALGGKIWVESEIGKGSTFHFTTKLPIDLQKREPINDLIDLAGKIMLVVDDNPVNRFVIGRMLEAVGISVREADSGSAALEILKKQSSAKVFDVVLMDANMPEMDGFTTAEKIRQFAHCDHIKMMMLSSGGIKGEGTLSRKAGFAAYLPKPVSRVELFRTLSHVLHEQNRVTHEDDTDTPVALAAPLKAQKSLRILLAEDHPVNQKLALNLLERWGHRVTVTADGQQAIDALATQKYDVILMDMMMPVMDGIKATQHIRAIERQEGRTPIPIIAMTANAMQGDKETCFAAGMDDYIAKPIKTIELQQILANYGANAPQTVEGLAQTTTESSTFTAAPAPIETSGFDYAKALATADQEMVEIVIDTFIEHCPSDLERLRYGLQSGDQKLISLVAHSFKGSLAIFSAQPAIDLATRLEKLAENNEARGPQILRLFEQFSLEIEQLFKVLKK